MRHGENTSTTEDERMKRLEGWYILPVVGMLLTLVACQAPKDYYLEFAKMERLGQELRQSSRVPSRHAEVQDPLLMAFEPGGQTSRLLRLEIRTPGEGGRSEAAALFRERVPVEVNLQALEETLKQKGITVTGVRTVDGRLDNGDNVVRVSFVPQAFSDEAIYTAYLLILAVVRGADTGRGSVDRVIGIVEDESANTQMVLEGQLQDYIRYVEQGTISYQEWQNRLKIRRFSE